VPLPADLISTSNTFQFVLEGHYEARCEDPSDARLWASIAPDSKVEIAGMRIPVADDLSQLPRPFYQEGVTAASTDINVAFADPPSRTMLRAAAVVSSWMGVTANSHGLGFPVSIGSLQAGNTIVLARNDSTLVPNQEAGGGPGLTIRTNPADGVSKLLVVSGDTDEQVLQAAQSLALGQTFSGKHASVTPPELPAPRKLDDAPRWSQTGHAASLWNYTETSDLHSDGSQPIVSYVRIPPDLFFGDHQSLPLRVDYAYKTNSKNGAFLRVTANGSEIAYLPLARRGADGSRQSAVIPLPVVNLRPFANTLRFDFVFPTPHSDACRPLPPNNSSGTLFRTSSLELKDLPHWAELPNLELFSNAGFPFTRYADLSHTTVVLPDHPNEKEVATMLAVLAYFGAQTGLPAFGVEIGGAESYQEKRDLLVIGDEADLVTTPALDGTLPLGFSQGGATRQLGTTLSLAYRLWSRLKGMDPETLTDLDGVQQEERLDHALEQRYDSILQAVESPDAKGSSVVVILLGTARRASLFPAFLKVASSAQLHGNLVVQKGSQFDSFVLNPSIYSVGHITVIGRIRAWMQENPWAGVMLPLLMGLLWAPWVKARLESRAAQRLRGDLAI
jgi:cellulose synthase (UDP-forming)